MDSQKIKSSEKLGETFANIKMKIGSQKNAKLLSEPGYRWSLVIFAILALLPFLFYMSILCDLRSEDILVKELSQCTNSLHKCQSLIFQPVVKPPYQQRNSSIVIGIPTVQRDQKSYLIDTLKNLLENMSEDEKRVVTIVVFIAEPGFNAGRLITQEILSTFPEHCDSGLIEIISPPSNYYPDFQNLPITLNDSIDRIIWRSKQNLDYAFLMNYAAERSGFYLQLEDDVVAKPGFVSSIKQFIDENSAENWLVLEFSELGFIGKLFRSSDLQDLATFFKLFFNYKPCDWLLPYFISTRYCTGESGDDSCLLIHAMLKIRRDTSLFQHVGTVSSLKGKVQLLQDDFFNETYADTSDETNP